MVNINPKLYEEYKSYITDNYHDVEDLDYSIDNIENTITFSAKLLHTVSKDSIDVIKYTENLFNITYSGAYKLNGRFYFTYKFND